ncbi:MAG: transcriptional regulator LuxR family [Caulobacter sp.]|nr:transcriptional regulator LuxR family [Caulobacter sp.]
MPASHVLVIDDSPLMTEFAADVLEQAGYRVSASDDPRGALGQIDRSRPDIVLVDADMPGLSGAEVLRMIRAEPALAGLPVILMESQTRHDLVGRVRRALTTPAAFAA